MAATATAFLVISRRGKDLGDLEEGESPELLRFRGRRRRGYGGVPACNAEDEGTEAVAAVRVG